MIKFTEEMKQVGFKKIPQGPNILRVTNVKPVKNCGKIAKYKVEFQDVNGAKCWSDYDLNKSNKWYVDAMRAFYSLLKIGCELEESDDGIQPEDAVGKYIIAKVKHVEKDDRLFVNLGYVIGHAKSFADHKAVLALLEDNEYDEYCDRLDKKEKPKADSFDDTDDDEDPYA